METRYRVPKAPAERQLAALIDYTRGQWSDGAGENFPSELPTDFPYGVELDWKAKISATVAEAPLSAEEQKRIDDELRRSVEGLDSRIQASKARVLSSK